MGNQSTSGIVEEGVNASNEAQEVSSIDNLRRENQTLNQEDDIKHVQEKTSSSSAADSNDAEAKTSTPTERLIFGEKEEHKEPIIEDCGTQTTVLPKESNLEEQIPIFYNDVQDQPYSLKGEMQRDKSNSTSNLNHSPQESVNITSKPQEDQNMLEKEIEEALELVNSYKADDHDVEINTQNEDTTNDNIEEGIGNEERSFYTSQEKENSLIVALHELQSISSQGFSASENDGKNEGFSLNEEILMINELGTSFVDQEINHSLICGNAEPETIICEIKKNEDEDAVEIEAEDQEDNKLTGDSSTIEKGHQSETINVVAEAEIPLSMSNEQFSNIETPMLVPDTESKGDQVHEVKKSTSFDFGLPFVALMPEESERTPLLYRERPVIRSFSTSSTMRSVQNRSVQTEVLGNSLRYEAVEVEEKTIRMEGSKYESSGASYMNLEDKEGTIAKQEDCDVVSSPKGNGKRKSNKPSLFSACMCCTSAIS